MPLSQAAVPPPMVVAPSAPVHSVQPASSEAAYEVGYGKPPVARRFKPGQSGNPRGRPKGSKNLDTMVREILDERITVNTPTGPKRVPRIEVLLRKSIEVAAKGNPRMVEQVLRQYAAAYAAQASAQAVATEAAVEVSEADVLAMAQYRDMVAADILAGLGLAGDAS
ncbi:DUF5681 domain-containing protein [Sphingomonas sp. KR1UV-12]|uniref:DUF5681 domain-containing protein n=1 Tax=Sphingomonas aurea TaxID=3063994 RepID=A0ABT9EJI2_9SPHN|nr:DUF5681 domain-containing protein [Sphingomonas sp. KR1UV-12]MDP1027101.1 DUF5681 domain-containing protein [Sphingomonas sp. KR1UV-12]